MYFPHIIHSEVLKAVKNAEARLQNLLLQLVWSQQVTFCKVSSVDHDSQKFYSWTFFRNEGIWKGSFKNMQCYLLHCNDFSRIRTDYREIRSTSPNSVRIRENTDQNNSEYGHFSRSIKSTVVKANHIGNF